MRPLVICPIGRAEIKRVMDFADKHRDPIANLHARISGALPPIGDNPNFVCTLPVGFRIVYSIEQQPIGWCRHISVSVDGAKLPNPMAVRMIADEFGFGPMEHWDNIWVENNNAVNVIERLK